MRRKPSSAVTRMSYTPAFMNTSPVTRIAASLVVPRPDVGPVPSASLSPVPVSTCSVAESPVVVPLRNL